MTALLAMARRDFLLARSYRLPFVADLTWGVIDLVVYFFISKVVGDVPAADLGGAPSYFAFALVGVLVSLVIGTATGEIAGRIRNEQLTGTLELLCAQPLRTGQLAAGYAAYPITYSMVRVAVYFLIGAFLMNLETGSADWAGVVVMLLVSAFAFLSLGILAAAATVVFKRG
jgi:ABC-2 type transport system permease protein